MARAVVRATARATARATDYSFDYGQTVKQTAMCGVRQMGSSSLGATANGGPSVISYILPSARRSRVLRIWPSTELQLLQ
jgi:hypothetical protein